jgi:hypothetical protein
VELLRKADWEGVELAGPSGNGSTSSRGVVTGGGAATDAFVDSFIEAIGHQRHWDRDVAAVPA